MMVSNGYSSWFWEYKGTGGWACEMDLFVLKNSLKIYPFMLGILLLIR